MNGYLVGNVPDPAIIGDTLSFECDPGYAIPLAYSSTMTCLESGQWDNVPKCVVGLYLALWEKNVNIKIWALLLF